MLKPVPADAGIPVRSIFETCAAYALSYAVFGLLMVRSISAYDEAIILVGAKQVQAGAIPYRDFYANYGPANFYILARIFDLFGSSVLVERAWDTAVRAALVVVAFHLVRRSASRPIAWTAGLLMTVWLGSLGTYSYPIFPSLLCCLSGLLCIGHATDARSNAMWLFAAGVAAGTTALFRFDAGIYAIGALGIAACLSAGWRRAAVPFAAGVAVVDVPVALALAAAGAVPDLLFDNLLFPSRAYAATRSLPFPTVSDLLADPYDIAIYAPVVVVGLSLVALALDLGRRPFNLTPRRCLVLSLCLLSSLLYLKGLVRVSVVHMALSLLPAVLLAVASLSLIRRGGLAINALVLSSLLVVAVPSLYALGRDVDAGRKTVAWASSPATWTDPKAPSSCRPPPHLHRLRCFTVDPTWSTVIAKLQEHSRADQPIFVGLAHHDRVFVDDILIYFAAQRRPATKWYHFDPGLQTTADIQEKIISDLRSARPPVAVLDDTWSQVREPNASALSSGITALDDYLAADFRSLERLGPYDVVVPRGG